MDRLKRSEGGFTLIELVIALALVAVVLISASNLLINFGRFSASVVKSEASLMGTTLGAFEEIVSRITAANEVTIPAANFSAPSIDIRISPAGAPANSSHASDVYHTYWKNGNQIQYKTNTGSAPAYGSGVGTVIATEITSLSFTRPGTDKNTINVILEAQSASGPTNSTSKEHLETTVVMRSRSAV